MTFEEKIRERIARAGHQSTEKNLFKLILGEIQQKGTITEEQGFAIVKKIIKGNDETLSFLPENDTRRAGYDAENDILSELLPVYLSTQEIEVKVQELGLCTQIVSAKNEGQAVGIVMSNFKRLSLPVEGEEVKKVVQFLRG